MIKPVPVEVHQPRRHSVQPVSISISLGNQSIPNVTDTFLHWDTEHTDDGGVWPSLQWGNDFIFGDDQTGLWIVTAQVAFAPSAVGLRRVWFENATGGAQDGQDSRLAAPAGNTFVVLTSLFDLAGSGVGALGLGVKVRQESGGALNVIGAASGRARLIAYRISR